MNRDLDEMLIEHHAKAGRSALGECNNIRCHIDTLLDKDFLAHIGAGSAEELHMRVFRIIQELNRMKGAADDVDPHEKNFEPCGNCGHMTLPTRARKCSNCHEVITPVTPPAQILC
jgi:NADH pyrophosphatase NudC (nudix superfamily)